MSDEDSNDISDPLFEDIDIDNHGSAIFDRPEILDIDYVPDENRIVGRNEQIREVAQQIGPAIKGRPANSLVIFGKTGCGKSLVAKHVMQRVGQEATNQGTNLATGYVSCHQAEGNFEVISRFGRQINVPQSSEKFPSRGLSASEYFDRLWTVLNNHYDGCILVLDEVDELKDDEVLLTFSRAGEDGSVDIPIAVIAISNKISFRDRLSEKTKSSFGHNDLVFDPYTYQDLQAILENRKDAFVEGALAEGVIPKAAALSAKEHGDARKAIRLLKYAGDVAKAEEADQVTEQHIEDARKEAEVERLLSLISGLPSHTRYIIFAMGLLKDNQPNKDWFKTSSVTEKYAAVCRGEGINPLSDERVGELLDELAFLEVTSIRRGQGEGKGHYKQHRLLWDPEIVFNAVET